MEYKRIKEGRFLERPNRFIAYVELFGKKETVHVKNTGRCKELLIKGTPVFLEESDNQARKTRYDLVAVKKKDRLINMDSAAPNKAVGEWLQTGGLFSDVRLLRAEKTYRHSRFDFYAETEGKKAFLEVKGVTLENDGVALFPDAPSERAVRHVEELMDAMAEGYDAYVIFVIQMQEVKYFTPNYETHPAFAIALQRAAKAGVHILAYDCQVWEQGMKIQKEVPVRLKPERKK